MPTTTAQPARPNIPARRLLRPLSLDEIHDGDAHERVLLGPGEVGDDRMAHTRFDRSVLESLALRGDAAGIFLRDVELTGCDLANAGMEVASWASCAVDGTKLTGTRLNHAILADVVCTQCRADLVQLQEARLQRVLFDGCNLQQAFFNGARLAGTVFAGCDLSGADFSRADLAGSDLRRSRIEGIKLAPDQLRGVIVTQDQALYLAGLLGLDVRPA
jgi:uncharacterized protein YjbI with pentapeptide repeats